MRTIILAAGQSMRLKPLTNTVPKTLLSLAGQPILAHIMDAVRKNNLFEFDIITGFGHDAVQQFAASYAQQHPETSITLHYNDEYNTAGNVVSFHRAQDIFHHDVILINSDTIFHPDIIKHLLQSPHQNAMVIDDYKKLGEEEMKVLIDENETIYRIHKTVPPKEAHGEYVGILKFHRNTKDQLFDSVREMMAEDNSVYYEDGIQRMIDQHPIQVKRVSTHGLPVMEIDTHEDYATAQQLIHRITCQ
ncbi:MAG TPA: phosphocholine cytidylyltransferase family protein [Patescibacteria group bacterium]|nr:phosphocholine cytidylyltransferase family protein [Patescibacteria group bacterium]